MTAGMIMKRAAAVAFMAGTVAAVVLGGATSASAAGTLACAEARPGDANVCVERSGNLVRGGVKYGAYLYDPPFTWVLLSCDGLGHNCGTYAATQEGDHTSWKRTAAGHTYKACGTYTGGRSLERYTNVCSGYISVP